VAWKRSQKKGVIGAVNTLGETRGSLVNTLYNELWKKLQGEKIKRLPLSKKADGRQRFFFQ
jgi:hypothetical protein